MALFILLLSVFLTTFFIFSNSDIDKLSENISLLLDNKLCASSTSPIKLYCLSGYSKYLLKDAKGSYA